MEQSFIQTPKKKFNWYSLITAVILLLVGLTILIWPGESSQVLVYVIAGLVMLAGIARIAFYIVRHESVNPFAFGGLSLGLSLVAVGVFFMLTPDVLITILPVTLGCLLIFTGFGSLQTAVELLRLRIGRWYIPLLFALAALVCGFVALMNPFSTAKLLMVFLGISLCVESVMLITSIVLFHKSI